MDKTILKAEHRQDKPRVIRQKGYVPGVLHGPGTLSTSVQFKETDLLRAFAKHGTNAKIYVQLDKNESYAIVKEVQLDPVYRTVVHVMIHLVSQDQEIKMVVPIVYSGREDLEYRQLTLLVVKQDIELSGKAAQMPESITVDVNGKNLDDSISSSDLGLADGLKILDTEDEIYAIVKELRQSNADLDTPVDDGETIEPQLVGANNSEESAAEKDS